MATATVTRRGSVMIKAGWVGDHWEYRSVHVEEYSDGAVAYYHGGPTCTTRDGMVTLPEEYRDAVIWDR